MTPPTSARRPASIERLPAVAKSIRSPSSKVQPATLSSPLDGQSAPDASGDRRAISIRNFPRRKRDALRKRWILPRAPAPRCVCAEQRPPIDASNLLHGPTFRTSMRLVRSKRRNLSLHQPQHRRTRSKLCNRREHLRRGGRRSPRHIGLMRPQPRAAGCRSVRWKSGSSVHLRRRR